MESTTTEKNKSSKKKGKSTFPKDVFEKKEWHERLGEDFWKQLHRAALMMEKLDRRLADPGSSTFIDYKSQKGSIAQGLALVATLDCDDALFLPRMISLAALYRGVTVEQFVGQWLGNLLDPGKGRLEPGNFCSEAFHLVPRIGYGHRWVFHAVGMATAMRLQNHSKLVCVPLFKKDLQTTEVQKLMSFVAKQPLPIAFLIVDGGGGEFAKAVGLREKGTEETDFLEVLKFLKNQLDRIRFRKEAAVLSFCNPAWQEQSITTLLEKFLDAKGWSQEETLHAQVLDEVSYGIERATMIPAPPKSTVVQDLTHQIHPNLERQWLEWRKVHGK